MNASPLAMAALLLCGGGCFSTTIEPDPCEATQACFLTDDIGCCAGDAINVSVCGSCPTGRVERLVCRASGCESECDTPLLCRTDLGGDCCGANVFTTDCDVCPSGSVVATSCTADYPDECGCDGIGMFRQPEEAPILEIQCYEDLGDCCGPFVDVAGPCGCRFGTKTQGECGEIERALPTSDHCRADLGGGCCGETVPANRCSAECPVGSIESTLCATTARDGGDRAPAPACFLEQMFGCCGEAVSPNACGLCPEGSSRDCDMFCD